MDNAEQGRVASTPSFRRTPESIAGFVLLAAIFHASPANAAESPAPPRTRDDAVLVFAAASVKPALDTLIASAPAKAIGGIKVSYAASSQLARQIRHDAPAALFISADQAWMDAVEHDGKLVSGTRVDLLGNALVLIAPRDSPLRLVIAPEFDLRGALGERGRLAIAEPGSVPAGKYARSALVSLGVWSQVEARIVAAVHVRAALNFVARKEAPLGIVYRSDAVSEHGVRVLDTFPSSTHAPIVYPLALLAAGDSPAARRLYSLLRGAEASAIFRRYGFDALAR